MCSLRANTKGNSSWITLRARGVSLKRYFLLHPNIPRLLQISARITLKRHQRVRFGNRSQLHHMRSHDFGPVFVLRQAQQCNQVILARHRVHLRYALDLQETLRRLVHLPALHIDQNQGGYHTATPYRGSVQTATSDTSDTTATNQARNYLSGSTTTFKLD